ncbi:MAG: hypothetical protein O2983_11850 [Planctomycetota bacterium]|nr:hypothetical protein [Planctomycetota bacterium]MDA0919231.1 hypothetical protein [Planctomycetota bacterium]MDA1160294.1 hypothetical protein [Planctomycetota bacterium]
MGRFALGVLLLVPVFGSVGCATSAKTMAMMPNASQIQLVNHHSGSVEVAVSGGKETNPLWTSQISSQNFEQALSRAVQESTVFSDAVPAGQGNYRLDVALGNTEQPMVGLAMTVGMTSHWKLSRTSDQAVVWQDTIHASYKAAFTEHLVGYERLRKANEGAARESIREGLKRLSNVQLDPGVQHATGPAKVLQ